MSDFNLRQILSCQDSNGQLPHHANQGHSSLFSPSVWLQDVLEVPNKGKGSWDLLVNNS